jgi:phosphate transport system protein
VSKHLQQDLEQLKKEVISMGALVEESLQKAINAFQERSLELAEKVITEDNAIDFKEVTIEKECLKMLALHQPVAEDLRFIAAVMKINNDLERMGDCAVHIARRTRSLVKDPAIRVPVDLSRMTKSSLRMVRECLDAFVRKDTDLARRILQEDDEVDECNHTIIRELKQMMHDTPDNIDQALDVFTATRRLERVGDLATSIAEDVIYLVEGEIIRHQG